MNEILKLYEDNNYIVSQDSSNRNVKGQIYKTETRLILDWGYEL